ncbi:MAG: hypothetical protein CMP49_00670 [Flavobacteriales bacterium]|jgi:murein DD-endopeptidase MepM/ murein hydrolase activator NlpD|nr:hypothetical protein [Flavobacteriales bacterium]|tara:strand:+ start:40355 stop:41224 length:870 start_codon:yes stop_codon:yes gene_type:complete
MAKSNKSYLQSIFNFFLKSYKISSVNKSTLQETPLSIFKAYQLFIYIIYLLFIFCVVIFILTAYGPLQNLLPQSAYFKKSELIELMVKVDSLESNLLQKSKYIFVLDKIINGEVVDSFIQTQNDSTIIFNDITLTPSKEDSLLRHFVENEELYNIPADYTAENADLEDFVFFKPADGMISSFFDMKEQHWGIDIVANTNTSVKATLDGVVIFSDWSVSSGHTIIIQHVDNIISVYMHNASLTKKSNDFVKSGEVIGIMGNSGESSSDPHLHFELWQNGTPIDPLEYLDF